MEQREGVDIVERETNVGGVEARLRLRRVDVAILAERCRSAERMALFDGVGSREVESHR